jgi:hypothetical protein
MKWIFWHFKKKIIIENYWFDITFEFTTSSFKYIFLNDVEWKMKFIASKIEERSESINSVVFAHD